MPSINLRLTDQELAELRAWAADSRRSLQKEIIWLLFADRSPVKTTRASGAADVAASSGAAGAQFDTERVTAPDKPRRRRSRPCMHYKGTESFCPVCDA